MTQQPGEAQLPQLFRPGRIGKFPTRNLIKYGACCVSNYNTRDGFITPRELARTRVIADTGCGIITNQGAYPDPLGEGKAYFRQVALFDDKFLPAVRDHRRATSTTPARSRSSRSCTPGATAASTWATASSPRWCRRPCRTSARRARSPRTQIRQCIRAARRGRPARRPRRASTAPRSPASWATCWRTSTRGSPTSAPTNTAARSRTAAASCAS